MLNAYTKISIKNAVAYNKIILEGLALKDLSLPKPQKTLLKMTSLRNIFAEYSNLQTWQIREDHYEHHKDIASNSKTLFHVEPLKKSSQ